MLEAPAFKTDGFLTIDTCISSHHLDRPTWNKETLTPPLKT
jgi:hypothetical protein